MFLKGASLKNIPLGRPYLGPAWNPWARPDFPDTEVGGRPWGAGRRSPQLAPETHAAAQTLIWSTAPFIQ